MRIPWTYRMTGQRATGPRPPRPGGILVAGGTGFVGRELVRRLLLQGPGPRVTTRTPGSARQRFDARVEVRPADWVTGEGVEGAAEGIRVAYYLVHSMGSRPDFADADRTAALHFTAEMARGGVERIVYLGGMGEESPSLSPHLASRREVESLLRQGPVPVTTLRAAIVLGAGGSSFEMLVQLVEKLPAMICPKWVETRCQPIALEELVRYLLGCADRPEVLGGTFDAGGPEILTYRSMMLRVGDRIGRRPILIVVPVLTPSLSAHWVGFITRVKSDIARPLVEGMKTPVVCRDDRINRLLPGPRIGFDEALDKALSGRPSVSRRSVLPRPP